jgi:hypothetical protein
MTTAIGVDSRSASEDLYHALRADFEAAYKDMMESSREFNAVLMNGTDGLSPEERRARNGSAARAYEDAHERFMHAVRKLNEFMIDRIIASRSSIHLVAPRR